jgi:hypothetical protein
MQRGDGQISSESRDTSTAIIPSSVITHLLTQTMEQSPSWEANRFSASQEIPLV